MSCSWVYILKGFNDYYYVGTTDRLIRRLKEHATGKGAKTTKQFKYNELVGLYKVGSIDELDFKEREKLEDIITLQLMKLQKNPKKVRGGQWTTHGVNEEDWDFSKNLINKLKCQDMPVSCHCKLPALRIQDKYVCSIAHNSWINEILDDAEFGIFTNSSCTFNEPLSANKSDEPNYCSVCSIPCSTFDACYEHKNNINLKSLDLFGITVLNYQKEYSV